MIDLSYEFFTLEDLSSPLKLVRAAYKPRGRGERNLLKKLSKLTQRKKTAILGKLKHDRFKL